MWRNEGANDRAKWGVVKNGKETQRKGSEGQRNDRVEGLWGRVQFSKTIAQRKKNAQWGQAEGDLDNKPQPFAN